MEKITGVTATPNGDNSFTAWTLEGRCLGNVNVSGLKSVSSNGTNVIVECEGQTQIWDFSKGCASRVNVFHHH